MIEKTSDMQCFKCHGFSPMAQKYTNRLNKKGKTILVTLNY